MSNWEEEKRETGEWASPGPSAPRDTRELEYLSLRIPVEIINSPRGGKVLSMHREGLQELLWLSDADISRLCDSGLIVPHQENTPRKPRSDREMRATAMSLRTA